MKISDLRIVHDINHFIAKSTGTSDEMDLLSTKSDNSSVALDSRSELLSTRSNDDLELLNSGLERLSTGSDDDIDCTN